MSLLNNINFLINDHLQENIYDKKRDDYLNFLKNKSFINKKSKIFLFHGTSQSPIDFEIKEDWDGDSGNTYMIDLPEGYLFLTDDIKEASSYGQYIIPCEFKHYSKLTINTYSNNPSVEFDDDFSGYGKYNMWKKFVESGKSILQVKGNNKSTFITESYNVIPRTDLAIIFYKLNK